MVIQDRLYDGERDSLLMSPGSIVEPVCGSSTNALHFFGMLLRLHGYVLLIHVF